jgi:hypothetical protein
MLSVIVKLLHILQAADWVNSRVIQGLLPKSFTRVPIFRKDTFTRNGDKLQACSRYAPFFL